MKYFFILRFLIVTLSCTVDDSAATPEGELLFEQKKTIGRNEAVTALNFKKIEYTGPGCNFLNSNTKKISHCSRPDEGIVCLTEQQEGPGLEDNPCSNITSSNMPILGLIDPDALINCDTKTQWNLMLEQKSCSFRIKTENSDSYCEYKFRFDETYKSSCKPKCYKSFHVHNIFTKKRCLLPNFHLESPCINDIELLLLEEFCDYRVPVYELEPICHKSEDFYEYMHRLECLVEAAFTYDDCVKEKEVLWLLNQFCGAHAKREICYSRDFIHQLMIDEFEDCRHHEFYLTGPCIPEKEVRDVIQEYCRPRCYGGNLSDSDMSPSRCVDGSRLFKPIEYSSDLCNSDRPYKYYFKRQCSPSNDDSAVVCFYSGDIAASMPCSLNNLKKMNCSNRLELNENLDDRQCSFRIATGNSDIYCENQEIFNNKKESYCKEECLAKGVHCATLTGAPCCKTMYCSCREMPKCRCY